MMGRSPDDRPNGGVDAEGFVQCCRVPVGSAKKTIVNAVILSRTYINTLRMETRTLPEAVR